MTLLFTDGFDAQDTLRKWGNTMTAAAYATGRYGYGFALYNGTTVGRPVRAITPSAQVITGCAFKITTMSSVKAVLAVGGDAGTTSHVSIEVTVSGAIQAIRTSTTIGTSPAGVISPGVWYYVELRTTIHDSTGIAELRVNGVQQFSFTGDTKNAGTSTNIDAVALGGNTAGGNLASEILFDDFYILNTLGSVNNTFLGETVVRTLLPTGAGASSALTPVGTANNWDNVNELGISVADYNSGIASGLRDTYALANLPVTPTAIYGVQTVATGAKTDVTATSLKPVVRSGGTNYYDPTLALSVDPTTTSALRETDPATSAAWTKAGVDALEVGAEVA